MERNLSLPAKQHSQRETESKRKGTMDILESYLGWHIWMLSEALRVSQKGSLVLCMQNHYRVKPWLSISPKEAIQESSRTYWLQRNWNLASITCMCIWNSLFKNVSSWIDLKYWVSYCLQFSSHMLISFALCQLGNHLNYPREMFPSTSQCLYLASITSTFLRVRLRHLHKLNLPQWFQDSGLRTTV